MEIAELQAKIKELTTEIKSIQQAHFEEKNAMRKASLFKNMEHKVLVRSKYRKDLWLKEASK